MLALAGISLHFLAVMLYTSETVHSKGPRDLRPKCTGPHGKAAQLPCVCPSTLCHDVIAAMHAYHLPNRHHNLV